MDLAVLVKQILNRRNIVRCISFVAVPAGLFFVLSVAILYSLGFTGMAILRDPAQQTGQSSFIGFVSTIGIWLWVSSFAICLFAALTGKFAPGLRQKELLVLLASLSILLAVDDFFLIHDRYVNQRLCYAIYALLAGSLLVRQFQNILRIDAFAFLLAGSLLALSILSDLVQHRIPVRYVYTQMFEEGFKFVGAAIWLYFGFRAASTYVSGPVVSD